MIAKEGAQRTHAWQYRRTGSADQKPKDKENAATYGR
jgi:hypothetical protein